MPLTDPQSAAGRIPEIGQTYVGEVAHGRVGMPNGTHLPGTTSAAKTVREQVGTLAQAMRVSPMAERPGTGI